MAHIVQMQLEKMNPQILDTFRQTMKIEDLSARGDALQAMVEKFNLGAMFGDAQTRDFLAPMLANMDVYRQLKASAMQAAGQHFIDDDFAAKMTSPGEQTKALQLSLNDLWLTVGPALMPAIGELAQTSRRWCGSSAHGCGKIRRWCRVAKVVGVIWLFNGALNILRLGANLIASPFIRLIDIFLKVKAGLALGGGSRALSVLKSFGNGAKSLTMLLGNGLIKGLRLVGQTFIWLGRALLMNPVGLTITAIAGAAYLLYRYWEPISGFFAGVWERIKTAFDGGIAGVTRLILDWSPLGLFYRAFASVLDWFGIELPASFSEFGGNILDSLINGILNALPFLNGAIEKIKALIPDWAKSALGISAEIPSVAAAVPGIAGTMVAQQASAPLASGAKAVTTPLASTAKTMASPQPVKTNSAATSPTPAALPGKSGGKPYTLPSRAQSNVQVHFPRRLPCRETARMPPKISTTCCR